jgi:lysophospholipase L1-like esterase
MVDASGSLAPAFHTGDGMHLSREGYAAWIEALRPALAAHARRPAAGQ